MGKKWPILHGKLLVFLPGKYPLEQKLHEDRDFWFAIVSPTELCLAPKQCTCPTVCTQEKFVE